MWESDEQRSDRFRPCPVSRRTLLGAAGAGAAGLVGLGACSTSARVPAATAPAGPGRTPDFVPFDEVSPDRPGTADGVLPGFYRYPDPPIDRAGFPLPEGESFTAMLQGRPPDVRPEENRNYAALAEQFGTSFQTVFGGFSGYTEKFQVTVAGGDLPDLMMIVSVAQLPRLLETHFADLTDILGGDGIRKYPGLANIPTPTWRVPSVNGRIWGVSQPRPPAGTVITSRGDVMAARGIDDPNVKLRDGDDFVDLLDQLTDRGKNEFAMGADPLAWLMTIVKEMVGTPNEWAVEGGAFVHENETEEMKEALEQAGKIIRAGYLHPNSFSDPGQNATWFAAGVTALYVQSFSFWGSGALDHPDQRRGNIEIPKWDGSGPAAKHKSVAGYPAYVALKKADDDRLAQLLSIIDFIASPFGTQQYLTVNYGVEDYSYRMVDGNPQTDPDAPQRAAPYTYAGSNDRAVLFGQGNAGLVDAMHDYLSRIIPDGVDNPTEGLYSETANTKAASMQNQLQDVQREVLQGTKPMSEWDDFVVRWKAAVGDAMAAEYAEAAAQQ